MTAPKLSSSRPAQAALQALARSPRWPSAGRAGERRRVLVDQVLDDALVADARVCDGRRWKLAAVRQRVGDIDAQSGPVFTDERLDDVVAEARHASAHAPDERLAVVDA